MKTGGLFFCMVAVVSVMTGAAFADNSGRIYGVITTVDGDVYEGLIRWDKNEGSWVDVLDGTKTDDDSDSRYDKARRSYRSRSSRGVNLFGWKVGDGNDYTVILGGGHSCGVRFGHIKSLEATGDDRALLVLKNGEEVELEGGSTDIGSAVREIVIEDKSEGEIEFVWDDIETIQFMAPASQEPSVFGERLYGTLTTRRGDTYTGFVCWDVDELFETDIIDGDEGRRGRKIRFDKIAGIKRYSSSGAAIQLKSGEEVVLRNSNDVDDSNRGICICDPGFGMVSVEWDEFEKLEFTQAPKAIKYDDLDGGRRLYGTVHTEDGETYTGAITWDDDEEYTWEMINGDDRDVKFQIELGLVKEIRKNSYRSATLVVLDGREFHLRGSNDVDEDNNGIFVELENGEEVEIDWEEFDKLEFTKR